LWERSQLSPSAIWTHLNEKNGNSTTIEDDEDHLLRAVLCVLHPEQQDLDLEDTAYFFRYMLAKSGWAATNGA
jgi:hypothetical protein